jgi:hypothetical protein
LPIGLLGLAAAFAAALGFAAPVLASIPPTHGGSAAPHARATIGTKKSTSFAGYSIDAKEGNSDITTTIEVPKLKCTKTNRAIGASAGLYEDSKTNFSSANLFIGCVTGKATYFPFLTVNGHEQDFRNTVVHPGDMVTLEVVGYQAPEKTTVSVVDLTHSFSKTKNGKGYSNHAGHPWIGDVTWSSQAKVLGVPDFGKIHFRTATINGNPFDTVSPQQRFDRYNKSKTTLQIHTGGYGPSKQAFGTTFKHS